MKFTKSESILKNKRFIICFIMLAVILGFSCVASAKNTNGDKTTDLTINVMENEQTVKTVNYTIDKLNQMQQVQKAYTTIDSMPAPIFCAAEGITLKGLLTNTDVNIDLDSIQSFKFYSTDGYIVNATKDYLLDTPRYYFPNFKTNSEEGKLEVEPILALKSYQERFNNAPQFDLVDDYNSLRLCFGQKAPDEITTNKFAKWVNRIDVNVVPSGTGMVTLSTPTANQSYKSKDIVSISGKTKNLNAVTVNVDDPDGTTIFTASAINVSSGSFATELTLGNQAKEGYYTIRISGTGLAQDYTSTFIVANTIGGVRLTSPLSSHSYKPGDRVTISGVAQRLIAVSVNITDPDGANSYTADNIDASSGNFTTGFTLGNAALDGNYTITVNSAQLSIPYKVRFNVKQNGNVTGLPDQIILSYTDDPKTSETISWRTESSVVQGKVQYLLAKDFSDSFDGASETTAVSSELYSGYNHFEATLRGLQPNTGYVYRVGNEGAWSDPATFVTAGDDNKFSFLYMGDVQEGYSDWGIMLNSAFTENPSLKFGVLGGDLVDDGDSTNEWQQFFDNASPVFNQIPLMPAIGNHDDTSLFSNSFALPQNGPDGFKEKCYSFDYKNCHFVVLDSNYLGSPGGFNDYYETIYPWLKDDLNKSWQKWKFVIMHHPPYPVVSDGSVLNLQKYWVPLLEEGKVDAVFDGHQHTYMRTKPIKNGQVQAAGNGIVYIMGNSGTKYYPAGSNYDYIDKEIAYVSNYEIIKINGDSLTLSAKDASGNEIDSYTMQKQPVNASGVYTITPITDTAYLNGITTDGITTMTVNSGISGLKHFTISISSVQAHNGMETAVFVHLRAGVQLDFKAIKADFDSVNSAVSSFNVQAGDVVKAYLVDDLTNALDFNPTILQE